MRAECQPCFFRGSGFFRGFSGLFRLRLLTGCSITFNIPQDSGNEKEKGWKIKIFSNRHNPAFPYKMVYFFPQFRWKRNL